MFGGGRNRYKKSRGRIGVKPVKPTGLCNGDPPAGWPANDRLLVLLTKHIGAELAYEKLERAAIVAEAGEAHLGKPSRSVGSGEYAQALRDWDPVKEPMPLLGFP